ncbi:MAG: EAL domain-containing protein [Lachnospiraceae bacterium]|nr:EAL domain-containing protein [Lachnospiraceae bacterium]
MDFHSKNMLVVAEGVEEKEEFDYLVGLGVDLFQGYYLARPA